MVVKAITFLTHPNRAPNEEENLCFAVSINNGVCIPPFTTLEELLHSAAKLHWSEAQDDIRRSSYYAWCRWWHSLFKLISKPWLTWRMRHFLKTCTKNAIFSVLREHRVWMKVDWLKLDWTNFRWTEHSHWTGRICTRTEGPQIHKKTAANLPGLSQKLSRSDMVFV